MGEFSQTVCAVQVFHCKSIGEFSPMTYGKKVLWQCTTIVKLEIWGLVSFRGLNFLLAVYVYVHGTNLLSGCMSEVFSRYTVCREV